MLASFLVLLRPLERAPLDRTLGKKLHGLLLQLVAERDPGLARRLHEDQRLRPFTVSVLHGDFAEHGGRRWVLPGRLYRARYTVLTEAVFSALAPALLGRQLYAEPVDIGGARFELIELVVEPGRSDGWADLSRYESLQRQAQAADRVTLEFASPAMVRQGDVDLLFPLPVSVFGSYLRRWQEFSPISLLVEAGDLLDWIEARVVAEAYDLHARQVWFGDAPLTGFTGWCRYRALDRDPARLPVLNLLADYALYCGTGRQTGKGLGQTRRRESEVGSRQGRYDG